MSNKNVHVLIHGQLCTMSEDELMHFKYIKREKLPDGSYRYYYDTTDELKAKQAAANEEAERQTKNYEAARSMAEKSDQEADKWHKRGYEAYSSGKTAASEFAEGQLRYYMKAGDEYKTKSKQYKAQLDAATAKGEEIAKELTRREGRASLSSLDDAIGEGLAYIANLFSGLFKKR